MAAVRSGVAHPAPQVVTWGSWGGPRQGPRARSGPCACGRCPGGEGLRRALGGVLAAAALEAGLRGTRGRGAAACRGRGRRAEAPCGAGPSRRGGTQGAVVGANGLGQASFLGETLAEGACRGWRGRPPRRTAQDP